MPSRLTPSHVGNCSVNGMGVCLSWKTVWKEGWGNGGSEWHGGVERRRRKDIEKW